MSVRAPSTSAQPALRGAWWAWLTRGWLPASMLLAVFAVAGVGYWDETREAAAALEEFQHDQENLAAALAAAVAARLALAEAAPLATPPEVVLPVVRTTMAAIPRPDALVVLLRFSSERELVGLDGRAVRADEIVRALDGGATSLRIGRDDASTLGLPARMAAAGLARVDVAPRRVGVVVVATAEPQRDRERRARVRLVLGVGMAAGLVVAFGGLALRREKQRLALARDLAIASVRADGDERLDRATKVAVLGTLATGIAHEVATPLGVIAGHAEQLLARADPDARTARELRAILAQTAHIDQVIRGFLQLAQGATPTFRQHAPAEIVDAARKLVEHRFDKSGVRLEAVIGAAPRSMSCNAKLLVHALVNLLLNACDACERGGTVSLRLEHADGVIRFLVVDDGVGISAENAARVTQPFFTTKGEGTGLGLAITNEIVSLHRGTLSLTAAPVRGTRACIEIPFGEGAMHDHD